MIRRAALLRYARALAEASIEKGIGEEILANSRRFSTLLEGVPLLGTVVRNPVLPAREKMAVVQRVAEVEGYHPYFRDFLKVLVENHRIPWVGAILPLFYEELDRLQGVVQATVQSAHSLTPDRLTTLTSHLSRAMNTTVILQATVDPELIGGIRVAAAGTVYDGSVRGQLVRLKEKMTIANG